jgi:hypothetical protein
MSRDEIQKLLGGYATDTLSEAERRALFAAALEDQDLFDALAEEQALRDVLLDPAARQQVIEALGPAREPFAARLWRGLRQPAVLAMAGGLAVLLIVAGIVLRPARHAARPEAMVADAITPTPPTVAPPAAIPPSAALRKKMESRVVGRNPKLPARLPADRALATAQPAAESAASPVPEPVPPPAAPVPPPLSGGVIGGVAGTPAGVSEAKERMLPATPAPAPVLRFGAAAGQAIAGGRFAKTVPKAAVQYSLLVKGADGAYSPVPAGAVFHAGDAVRVQINPGEGGYAYLLQREGSGGWKLVASQQVEKGQRYELPPTGGLQSDVPARLVLRLVLSRREQADVGALATAGQVTAAITVEYR